MKRWIAFSICMAMLAGVAGCAAADAAGTENLMENITPKQQTAVLGDGEAKCLTAAAAKLLQNTDLRGNTLLSPLSVLCAVGMTANGADGTTRAQFEDFFGMSVEDFNRAMTAWLQAQDGEALCAANSLWLRQGGLKVSQAFLQTNADYYGAAVYQTAFDGAALRELNEWVSGQTDGMIPEMLDFIPPNAVMYLVNALCFRCKWETEYTASQVSDGTFTTEAGQVQAAEMMFSKESVYLENENASGFLKPYAGGQYAFVALLPRENLSLADFVATLDGDTVCTLLATQCGQTVEATMPKFETTYSAELSEVFQRLGVSAAFDPDTADFSGIDAAAGDLYISRILHKTFIRVNETGTEAAAATAAELQKKSMRPLNTKTVVLDRPFVYLIVDTATDIPVFVGTVATLAD